MQATCTVVSSLSGPCPDISSLRPFPNVASPPPLPRTPHLPFVLSLTRVHRQPAGSANQQRCFHQSALPSRRSLEPGFTFLPPHVPSAAKREADALGAPDIPPPGKTPATCATVSALSGLSQAYFPYPSARVLIAPRSSHPAPWAPLFRKQRPLGNLTRTSAVATGSCLMRQAGHSLQLKSRHGGGYFPLARLTPFPTSSSVEDPSAETFPSPGFPF